MESFTKSAQEWLSGFFSNQEPYISNSEFGKGKRRYLYNLGLTCRIAAALSQMDFNSILDVGSANGFNTAFIQQNFDVFGVASDLSPEGLNKAYQQYGLDTIGVDAHNLPFKTDSFDVVTCNEVIEHVLDPVQTMLELFRVAKKYVIISTIEYEYRSFWRGILVRGCNPSFAHDHRTKFTHSDFKLLFSDCDLKPLLQMVNWELPGDILDSGMSIDQAKDVLFQMTGPIEFSYQTSGVIVVIKKNGAKFTETSKLSKKEIIDRLFCPIGKEQSKVSLNQDVSPELIGKLVCPCCGSSDLELIYPKLQIKCLSCSSQYVIHETTPLLFPQVSYYISKISPNAFVKKYSGINQKVAVNLQKKIVEMPRYSNKFELIMIRVLTALLNFVSNPRIFIRYQFSKMGNRKGNTK